MKSKKNFGKRRVDRSKATRKSQLRVHNARTRDAIAELEAGKGERYASVGLLMADLEFEDGERIALSGDVPG